jgi:UDP-N-acetylmuramoyl-tripeptide--D-alanyl-D-alanine ligase
MTVLFDKVPSLSLTLKGITRPLLASRARFARAGSAATIVAVTGSSGKTTTTQLIGRILSECGTAAAYSGHNTLKAIQKNLLSTARVTSFHVQEVSGGRPGAAAQAASVLKPDVAVVTVVAAEHLKQFRSLDAIAAGKGDLVAAVPADGVAVLNADDQRVAAMRCRTRARVVTYGLSRSADVRCLKVDSEPPEGIRLVVSYAGQPFTIRSHLVGAHWLTSILASVSAGLALGATPQECIQGVAAFRPEFGRCSVHSMPDGPLILHDACKAAAWSIDTFLALVSQWNAVPRTIVFGIISDIARDQGIYYRSVAKKALAVADRVIFVGWPERHLRKMTQELASGRLILFPSTQAARSHLAETCRAGEAIFLKANYSSHLERIVLDWQEPITCWTENCGRKMSCAECNLLRHVPSVGGVARLWRRK